MWSGKSNFGQYDLRWTNVEWVDPDIEDSADPNAGPDLGVWGNCTDVLICLGNPWKSSKIHGVCGLTNFNVVTSIYKLQMEFRILALLSDLSISDGPPSPVNFDWLKSDGFGTGAGKCLISIHVGDFKHLDMIKRPMYAYVRYYQRHPATQRMKGDEVPALPALRRSFTAASRKRKAVAMEG